MRLKRVVAQQTSPAACRNTWFAPAAVGTSAVQPLVVRTRAGLHGRASLTLSHLQVAGGRRQRTHYDQGYEGTGAEERVVWHK